MKKIDFKKNLADILTKPLLIEKFKLSRMLRFCRAHW